MGTKIQWTEETWNPIVGCSVLTPGCTNCYAMKMAWRLANNSKTPHYAGTVEQVKGKAVWTGKMALAPERVLMEPLRRRKPTMYFVNSMGDLFHENVPDGWILRVFAIMEATRQHRYQVLTKRSERQRDFMRNAASYVRKVRIDMLGSKGSASLHWPPSNVWLGVSAERQKEWDERKEHLRDTPAAVRFASFEPLLGPIEGIPDWLDWAIVGGESGPGAREMDLGWARDLRDQCAEAGVPFFFKQTTRKGPIPPDLMIRQFPEPAP